MIDVNDVFINNEDSLMLRVLSCTGEGFDQQCYCLLERNGECWNGYHSALHIERYYTKMGSFNE